MEPRSGAGAMISSELHPIRKVASNSEHIEEIIDFMYLSRMSVLGLCEFFAL
jgi:hypothetical protein